MPTTSTGGAGSWAWGRPLDRIVGARGAITSAYALHYQRFLLATAVRAIFIGNAKLDDNGRAHLEGRLPDNLTRFRVTALVSAPIVTSAS